jgi:hypothetical protein
VLQRKHSTNEFSRWACETYISRDILDTQGKNPYKNSTREKAPMTKKKFLNRVSNSQEDIVQHLLDLLKRLDIEYCVIGGLAVNAYAEPVVSLDLDIVVIADALDTLITEAKKYFKIESSPHSLNLKSSKSDLRIQIQTDPRYQPFIKRASVKTVMDYEMKVAAIEDVLQGKVWAYSDKTRRASKRQKDLADIFRIIEESPGLKKLVPPVILRE